MKLLNDAKQLFFIIIISFSIVFSLTGCESETEVTDKKPMETNAVVVNTASVEQINPMSTAPPELENKSYLFNVKTHSPEELEALLNRADEVAKSKPEDFADLEIVMVIHGPDIDMFTTQNYVENQKLIDLAARLDAYEVIDMKVCETTMSMRGVDRQDIPAFIESVPFAPTEIKERIEQGYINL